MHSSSAATAAVRHHQRHTMGTAGIYQCTGNNDCLTLLHLVCTAIVQVSSSSISSMCNANGPRLLNSFGSLSLSLFPARSIFRCKFPLKFCHNETDDKIIKESLSLSETCRTCNSPELERPYYSPPYNIWRRTFYKHPLDGTDSQADR